MTNTFKISKHGTTFSPHVLEDIESGKKKFLCACGGTHNADGTCDGTHNKKKTSGCNCEYCVEKPGKDN